MEGGQEPSDTGNKSTQSFRERVDVALVISGFFLVLITLSIVSNGVFNFLRAPIGIKDNSPDPGLLVRFAQLAFYPVGTAFALLFVVKKASESYWRVPTFIKASSEFGNCLIRLRSMRRP